MPRYQFEWALLFCAAITCAQIPPYYSPVVASGKTNIINLGLAAPLNPGSTNTVLVLAWLFRVDILSLLLRNGCQTL